MRHPSQATLALHAGGDLPFFAEWRTERHVLRCERCREEIAGFDRLREMLPELSEVPEIEWNRLAAEMKANIRLGLAAGECVRPTGAVGHLNEEPLRGTPLFGGARAAFALAGVMALLVIGIVLERPAPQIAQSAGIEATADADGIQVESGGQAFRLRTAGARNVSYSVGVAGSMGARYVDPKTGFVTINSVYAE